MECLPEEAVEDGSCRTRVVSRAHLAQDLSFTGNHRVEARSDPEEVQRGGLIAQAVERRAEVGLEREQRGFGTPLGVATGLVREIELRSVAGRETHCFARRPLEPVRKLCSLLAAERCPLAELNRRAVMGDPDEDDPHEKCVTGNASRTTATRRKPASTRYAARRPRNPAPKRRTR